MWLFIVGRGAWTTLINELIILRGLGRLRPGRFRLMTFVSFFLERKLLSSSSVLPLCPLSPDESVHALLYSFGGVNFCVWSRLFWAYKRRRFDFGLGGSNVVLFTQSSCVWLRYFRWFYDEMWIYDGFTNHVERTRFSTALSRSTMVLR